jgi:NAD(P)-dependent dehydrogenase (short-subunit alcohol dehydrogenase family)
MSRIFITGSADGLGQLAARLLVAEGHEVILHARNEKRAKEAMQGVPGAKAALCADLSSIRETRELAAKVNALGEFDAVIHNAAVGYRESKPIMTVDHLPHVFAINSLAPYILSCLINKPKRLIYISSGLNRSGDSSLEDIAWSKRAWSGYQAYSDSKLHNLILALAIARKWPDVYSNAMEPGWVATKMGGAGAPDSLEGAPKTQVWLATSADEKALVSGQYFFHKKPRTFNRAAADINIQEKFLFICSSLSGIEFPG